MNNSKNIRNRPKAIDYREIQESRGTGQLEHPDLELLRSDPVSYYHKKLQNHPYKRDDFWTEAARRGESDLLISLLELSSKDEDNKYMQRLEDYPEHVDYDTYMTTLQIPHLDDKEAKPRINEDIYDDEGNMIAEGDGYNFGDFTDKQWAERVFEHTLGRWDAINIEMAKENMNFFIKASTVMARYTGGALSLMASGVFKFLGDVYNLGEGVLNVLFNWTEDKDLAVRFLAAYADDDTWGGDPFGKISALLSNANYEFQRKHTGLVNAVEAYDQGYTLGEGNYFNAIIEASNVGAGRTTRGKIFNGTFETIGYLLPVIALAYLTGGTSVSASSGVSSISPTLTATTGSALSKALTIARPVLLYSSMFSGTVKENLLKAEAQGRTYKDAGAMSILTNAAVKTMVRFAIDKTVGMIFGYTSQDNIYGLGKGKHIDSYREAIDRGIVGGKQVIDTALASTKNPVASFAWKLTRDANKDGLKRVGYDLANTAIDWAYDAIDSGDFDYKQGYNIQNVIQTYSLGFITSLAMTGISEYIRDTRGKDTMFEQAMTGRKPLYGATDDGQKPLNFFERAAVRDSVATLKYWANLAKDPNTPYNTRESAIMALDMAHSILGDYMDKHSNYDSMTEFGGKQVTPDTAKAVTAWFTDQSLQGLLEFEARSQSIDNKTDTQYVSELTKTARETLEPRKLPDNTISIITNAMIDNVSDFRTSYTTNITSVVTRSIKPENFTDELNEKWLAVLRNSGRDIIVAINGASVITSDKVLFVPDKLFRSNDFEMINQVLVNTNAIDTLILNLDKNTKNILDKAYSHFDPHYSVKDSIRAIVLDTTNFTNFILQDSGTEVGLDLIEAIDKSTKKISSKTLMDKSVLHIFDTMRKAMAESVLNYATTVSKVDDDKIAPIVGNDIVEEIKRDKNVRFTKLVDDVLNVKGEIPLSRIDEFNNLIDKFDDMLKPKVIKELKDAIKSPDYNKRVDATIALTYLLQYYSDEDRKLTYLPTDNRSSITRTSILVLNTTLGVDYKDFIDNTHDPTKLTSAAIYYQASGIYNIESRRSRIAMVRDILYNQSNKSLTIGINGEVLKVVDKHELVKPKYLSKSGDRNLMEDIVEGRVTKAKDILKVNVDKRIGKLEVEINSSMVDENNVPIHKGYYIDGEDKIVIGHIDTVNNVMHELTHATQYYTQIGIPEGVPISSGGDMSMFNILPPAVRDSLTDYIKENFPLSNALLKENNNNSLGVVYLGLEGELQAHANLSALIFEAGFTWKAKDGNPRAILVSPDGKKEWSMDPSKRRVGEGARIAKGIAKEAKGARSIQLKSDLKNLPGNVSLPNDITPQLAKQIDNFYSKYPLLREWVEGNLDKTNLEVIQEAVASKQEGLKFMYEELYKVIYNQQGNYDQFLKTPIHYARTTDTYGDVSQGWVSSVSLGYDLNKIPLFGVGKSKYVMFGKILPDDLVTYLPLSYAEGILKDKTIESNNIIQPNNSLPINEVDSLVRAQMRKQETSSKSLQLETKYSTEVKKQKIRDLYDAFHKVNPKISNFEFADMHPSIGGLYDPVNDKLIINQLGDPTTARLSHELTHSLEGTKSYDQLKQYIEDFLKRAGTYDSIRANITKTYKDLGLLKGLTKAQQEHYIDTEIVSDFTKHLFKDRKVVNDFARANRNLFTKILDWIKGLLKKLKGKLTKSERTFADDLKKIEQQYLKVLKRFDPDKPREHINPKLMVIGPKSQKAKESNYEVALAMKENKASIESIRKETGWTYEEKTGNWKYEISDTSFKVKLSFKDLINIADSRIFDDNSILLKDLATHNTLFEHYPFLKDTLVFINNEPLDSEDGSYLPYSNEIEVNLARLKDSKLLLEAARVRGLPVSKLELKATVEYVLLHEITHTVQTYEGFGPGANYDQIETALNKEVDTKLLASTEYQIARTQYFHEIREIKKKYWNITPSIDMLKRYLREASYNTLVSMIENKIDNPTIAKQALTKLRDAYFELLTIRAGYFKTHGYDYAINLYDYTLGELEANYVASNWKRTQEEIQKTWDKMPNYSKGGIVWESNKTVLENIKNAQDPNYRYSYEKYHTGIVSSRSKKPSLTNPATFKGKKFWIGTVSLLDGVIEETHTYQTAKDSDFHHSLYFSVGQQEKIMRDENALFWVEADGRIQGEWRTRIPGNILHKIQSQIELAPEISNVKTTKTGVDIVVNNMIDVAKPTDYGILLNKLLTHTPIEYDIDWKTGDNITLDWSYLETVGPLLLIDKLPVRRLTPLETGRLMGLRDSDFKKLARNQSDTSVHRLLGNSIVVDVLEHIFDGLYEQEVITKPVKLIEFFAGYGSPALALKYLNADFEQHKIVEWTNDAIIGYNDLHSTDIVDHSKDLTRTQVIEFLVDKGIAGTQQKPLTAVELSKFPEPKLRQIYNGIIANNNLVDITKVSGESLEISNTDQHDYVLTYSFPCQDLSLMGVKAGMDEGTRSGLLWEVERILNELPKSQLPKILLMENVTAIHNKNNEANFIKWQKSLEKLGYTNYWQDMIASDYGVPQSRDRTFMVSVLGDNKYSFPKPIPLINTVDDLRLPDKEVGNKYWLTSKQIQGMAGLKGTSWQAKTPEDLSETIRMINLLDKKGTAISFSERLNSRTFSNQFANQSNLKYWIRKGKRAQADPRIQDFVIATTGEDFDKLPNIIKSKIYDSELTMFDIIKFVATSKNTNIYTHQMIARHIYQNPELAKLKPSDITRLGDNIHAIARLKFLLDEDPNDIIYKSMSPKDMIDLYQSINDLAKKDYNTEVKLDKADRELNRTVYRDVELDLAQLPPIVFRHYDGTIESVFNILKLFTHQMYKQKLQLLDTSRVSELTQDSKARGTGRTTVYNWLDKLKQTDIAYDYTSVVEVFKDIDPVQMADTLKHSAMETLIEKYSDLSRAELNERRFEIEAEQEELLTIIDSMNNAQLAIAYSELMSSEISGKKLDPRTIKGAVEIDMSAEPSIKNIKDLLRSRARTVTTRIAGLKTRYNQLPDIIKKNLDPKTFKLTKDYTDMSREELLELSQALAETQTQLSTIIKGQDLAKKKQTTIEKRLAKLASQERKTKENIAKLKEQEKTMRDKLRQNFKYKIVKGDKDIVFKSDIDATKNVKDLLSTQWEKTTQSKVQGLSNNKEQNVHNATTFYTNNRDTFLGMSTGDAEAVANWFIEATVDNLSRADSDAQTFEAIRIYTLGYTLTESTADGQWDDFNPNLRQKVENTLKNIATLSGTGLAVWNNIRGLINPLETMLSAEMILGGIEVSDVEKSKIIEGIQKDDYIDIQKTIYEIINRVNEEKFGKQSISRKVTAFRAMMMLSKPITWLRLQISKRSLRKLNQWSTKVINFIKPKTKDPNQITLKGKITPEIQEFITKQFLDTGLFDTVVNNISRYNPSSIRSKYRDSKGLANKDAILHNLVIKSMYNQYYNQNLFNSDLINSVHRGLMKALTDNKIVRETTIRYFGKLLAEKGYDLTNTPEVTDAIMNDFATALGMAMQDYMHEENIFSQIETVLANKSESALFAFKLILPFAKAQWNWFRAMVRYGPVGLVQSIIRYGQLEENIKKAENDWASGKSNVHPEMTEFMIRRDIGSGIIGTLGVILGLMLAGLGFIDLEEEDYGTPKLRVGNVKVDISSIFGSTSILAGAAIIKGWQNADDKRLLASLNAMLDPVLDGFFLMQIMALDKFSYDGFASTTINMSQQILLSFWPSLFNYLAGATYSGQVQTNKFYQKAIKRIPFLNMTLPKKIDPHTGESGGIWDIFNRMVPYFEVRTTSELETNAKALGINKLQLRGQYEINGEKFKLSARDTAELNRLYGQWNANLLTQFYRNQSVHKVQMPNGTYKTLRYNQMTEQQRQNTVKNLYNKNADYAKIYAWLKAGNKYYASDAYYSDLRRLGITKGLYKGSKGFSK